MMTAAPHIPVLLAEVLDGLAVGPGGTYVDGTFGAGGYTRAILEAAADTRVIAIDRDPDARPRAEALSALFPGRLFFLPGRFGDMQALIDAAGLGPVDGVTLDVGVSSMQIDTAARGFSFMKAGPLDMRMEQAGRTAADVVNETEESDLADIIYQYGEERLSRRIARAIVEDRRVNGPIETTGRLAEIVRRVVPKKSHDAIDPATRTFQGLRIYVNDEIGELQRGLTGAEALLRPGGRLAVVSFHSLEDREVKTFLADRTAEMKSRPLPGEKVPPRATFQLVSRKAIRPGDEECRRNPRARSSRLRVAERTDAPPRDSDSPPHAAAHAGFRRGEPS